ncbi:MAG: alpha/beta hydrolase family esterase [Chloroflexota bacterium]
MKSNLRGISLFWGTLFLAMLACGKTPAAQPPSLPEPASASLPVGDSEHRLAYAGVERSYVLHIPPGYDPSQPAALVLAFHGITLDAYEMIRISGFNAQSDAAGFIVAYPNAAGEQRSWNGGHCCGEAARDNVDDLGFVRAVIADISASLDIDPKRIYATGFSNGAILAYRLACEMADQIAAIAPVSATQALEDQQACQPSRPVPVIHFHGTDDEPNPYDGGVTPGGVQFIPVTDAIRFWVDLDGCPVEPQREDAGSIVHDVYAPCQAGSSVELYTITGGEHAWPGGEAVSQRMGEPNMEISATALIWEFFLAHPMP